MPTIIPTFTLSVLAAYEAKPAGIFVLGRESGTLQLPCFQLFRSSYYQVGICLHGCAEL